METLDQLERTDTPPLEATTFIDKRLFFSFSKQNYELKDQSLVELTRHLRETFTAVFFHSIQERFNLREETTKIPSQIIRFHTEQIENIIGFSLTVELYNILYRVISSNFGKGDYIVDAYVYEDQDLAEFEDITISVKINEPQFERLSEIWDNISTEIWDNISTEIRNNIMGLQEKGFKRKDLNKLNMLISVDFEHLYP